MFILVGTLTSLFYDIFTFCGHILIPHPFLLGNVFNVQLMVCLRFSVNQRPAGMSTSKAGGMAGVPIGALILHTVPPL